jgi:hypothetical protein
MFGRTAPRQSYDPYSQRDRRAFGGANRQPRTPKGPTLSLAEFLAYCVDQVIADRGFVSKAQAEAGFVTAEERGIVPARNLDPTGTGAFFRFKQDLASGRGAMYTERAAAGAADMAVWVEANRNRDERVAEIAADFNRFHQVHESVANLVARVCAFYATAKRREKEQQAERAARSVDCNAKPIFDMMKLAMSHGLRNPKITFKGDTKVRFAMAGPGSKYRNQIIVTDGLPYGQNKFFGTITEEGLFTPSRACDDAVRKLIVDLATDPTTTAAVHGVRTGNCCFCGHELTKGISVDTGVGPICADKYGIDRDALQAAALAAREAMKAEQVA